MSRRLALALLLAVVAVVVVAAPAFGTTYYVANTGSDTASGTNQAAPWRTVARANRASLQPGDSLLFEGGDAFTDSTLMPPTSGTAGAPITFGSYGTGRASIQNTSGAVWFAGKSWLNFDNLRLTSEASGTTVFAGSGSAPSTHITLTNSIVTDSNGVGVYAPNANDANWTISGTTVSHVGDSGLIMLGGPHLITHNTITDTGGNTGLAYGRHGIYSKGPDQTISYNDFSSNLNGQAISIRFHGARVIGNTIHDVDSAIAFFDYDTGAAPQGTSYVYGNRAWNIALYAFYYDGQLDPQGQAPTVDFVVASNTFQLANASEAVNVAPSGSAHVTLVNNVFTGTYGSELRTASTTVENHNLFASGTSNRASGSGDLHLAARLGAAPDFTPSSSSPAVDAGTTSVSGLTYVASCDGTVLSYCGSSPDLGAVETAAAVTPLSPPSGIAAGSVAQTSLTLSWSASGDPRVSGYDVLRDGSLAATASLPIATLSGLACGTTYTFSVRATGSAATSSAISTSTSTAPCSPRPTTTTVTTTTTTTTTTPVTTAPAGAAAAPSGGGGGGGVPPEIAVSMSFGPQPANVGDQFDYAVSLVNNSIQGADRTVLTVNLPAGVEYVGARVTRGSGCAAAGRILTCDLDFFPGKLDDTVRISVKVLAKTDLAATASVWTMPANSAPANNTATATVSFGGSAATAPSTLGSFSTPAPGKTPASTGGVRTLQTAPASGSIVSPRFLVVAKSPKTVKAVAFALDGRRACVDRAAPFSCALDARPGWHSVQVRPLGGPATTIRLRVVG